MNHLSVLFSVLSIVKITVARNMRSLKLYIFFKCVIKRSVVRSVIDKFIIFYL